MHEEVWCSLIWAVAVTVMVGIIIGGAYLRSAHQNTIFLSGGYQERQIGQTCTPIVGWQK